MNHHTARRELRFLFCFSAGCMSSFDPRSLVCTCQTCSRYPIGDSSLSVKLSMALRIFIRKKSFVCICTTRENSAIVMFGAWRVLTAFWIYPTAVVWCLHTIIYSSDVLCFLTGDVFAATRQRRLLFVTSSLSMRSRPGQGKTKGSRQCTARARPRAAFRRWTRIQWLDRGKSFFNTSCNIHTKTTLVEYTNVL